ncbi:hypothetical protein [Alicyclobacillus mengziensis]|uniref:Uncharacterized protein n=1 Tax=Alicyclobacillus mengziensis TaxID=2931921 RepID=A0A9X7VY72_9BACL|nr:hypothetical protein [Alicyclobacillus mengziensis]QSO46662.1 hypothetical protein JZ786_19795 [Alicyclobacillus mengziensis]
MGEETKPCIDISEAVRKVNLLVKQARQMGTEILGMDIGPHMNPGDVYDAYEAIKLAPVAHATLDSHQCGPFAAVFLYEQPDVDPSGWQDHVTKTYDNRYVKGFYDGFQLNVPGSHDGCDAHYIRGVYDGVMAHSAVF